MRSSQINITQTDPIFESLLEYLRFRHNFDFTGYKRSSLIRRFQERMRAIAIESYNDYKEYLKVHPEDFTELFNTIEINVSCFFRDASCWDYVTAEIIPRIIAGKSQSEPIRVWSAGCASGEEAYTLAMVLASVLGIEQFRERVKIFATDIDSEALAQARAGRYFSSQVVDIPPSLLNQYFERTEDCYVFRQDLRRSILWSRHNMIDDAPMSKIDLLVCRNALIYFNIEAQTRVLARFYFSLLDSGFLFLGRADGLPTHTNFFAPVCPPQHIFTKVAKSKVNERLLHKSLLRNPVRLIP